MLSSVESAPHVAGSIDEAVGRLHRGEPFCAAPLPAAVLGPATAMVKDLPMNLWQGALAAGHHMFKPWGEMANGDHDGTKGLWDWRSGNSAEKLDRLRRAANSNSVAGLKSGMVNVYGSDLHVALSVPIAEAFERSVCANQQTWNIGHNRMFCRLKSEQLSLDGCKYHYEGRFTGLGLDELVGHPFIGVICSVPTQARGLCGIRYRPGHDHASFTAAVATDRSSGVNVVNKANNFFLGLGAAFWTATEAGKTVEPVEVIFPADHVILFNGCLPHGVSKATAGLGIYMDLSPGEDAAAAPHDAFHALQVAGRDLADKRPPLVQLRVVLKEHITLNRVRAACLELSARPGVRCVPLHRVEGGIEVLAAGGYTAAAGRHASLRFRHARAADEHVHQCLLWPSVHGTWDEEGADVDVYRADVELLVEVVCYGGAVPINAFGALLVPLATALGATAGRATRAPAVPLPTKGYFDAETYALPWRLHKLWVWCMQAPPSHWPSGKQTFLVHTMASAAAAKKSLRQRCVVEAGAKRSAQFRYPSLADRTVTLDIACKAQCERKGFTVPVELLGKRVMRDPSALPWGYAVRFGWPAVKATSNAAVPAAVAAEGAAAQQASRAAHIPTIAKYPQLEKRLRAARPKKKTREWRTVKVEILWGAGGTCKSRDQIYDKKRKRGDNFIVPDTANLKWWDGYDGEETIVIEGFKGSRTCDVDRFKRLLDGHQLKLDIKGGHTYAAWTTVKINSNLDPAKWYDIAEEYERSALFRRFNSIVERTQRPGSSRDGTADTSPN